MAVLALAATGALGAPSRSVVYVVNDPGATEAFRPNPTVVAQMVDKGMRALGGRSSASAVWRDLITTNDVVGFKVTSGPGAVSGTRHEVVEALVRTLLAAGHPPRRVVIWDRRMMDLQAAGWPNVAAALGVRCAGAEDSGWERDKPNYEKAVGGKLVAGDLDFGRQDDTVLARISHVSRLLRRDITRIVTVAPVLNHNHAGVNGNLVGLAISSVDNVLRFAGSTPLLAEAAPEICALPDLAPKVLFGVSDALICQYRGEETILLHYANALNELRFSRDLVALDALALSDVERMRRQDAVPGEEPFKTDLYSNAELIDLGVADRSLIDVRKP